MHLDDSPEQEVVHVLRIQLRIPVQQPPQGELAEVNSEKIPRWGAQEVIDKLEQKGMLVKERHPEKGKLEGDALCWESFSSRQGAEVKDKPEMMLTGG